jgi:hypothetical protein
VSPARASIAAAAYTATRGRVNAPVWLGSESGTRRAYPRIRIA